MLHRGGGKRLWKLTRIISIPLTMFQHCQNFDPVGSTLLVYYQNLFNPLKDLACWGIFVPDAAQRSGSDNESRSGLLVYLRKWPGITRIYNQFVIHLPGLFKPLEELECWEIFAPYAMQRRGSNDESCPWLLAYLEDSPIISNSLTELFKYLKKLACWRLSLKCLLRKLDRPNEMCWDFTTYIDILHSTWYLRGVY